MSLKSALVSRIAARLTSKARQTRARARAERDRQAAGLPHVVDYFHQADDPYSALLVQVLPLFAGRYDVELRCHLAPAPADWAAPERERLEAYSRLDAARLAERAGLSFADPGRQPPREDVQLAERRLASSLKAGRFLADGAEISEELWSGTSAVREEIDAREALRAGETLRDKLGHYLGGTLHYGGEWYWGLDRLHYLEERLAELGARRADAPGAPIYPDPETPMTDARPVGAGAPPLDFFLSFRSPYTYLAVGRVKALADAYGVDLKLRFVLPMVMRGLPVPPSKRGYITQDAAREARRLGVPFGRIADPVGRPVERGYSLLPWAISQGRGHQYCLAFMRAVWSRGVDAGSEAGMQRIVTEAGLDWNRAKPLLGADGWRAEAEANRRKLLSLGLWGVPSFRFGETAAWGQDRLWVIENAVRRHAGMSTDRNMKG